MTKKFFSIIFLLDLSMCAMQIDHGLITEIFQSEAAITYAEDAKPIIATYGCGPCVAVGGYDCVNKSAFMVHFATSQEVLQCGQKILDCIRTLVKKKITMQAPITLHLRGGQKGMSEKTLLAINYWINMNRDLPMIIGSRQILCFEPNGKSLMLDSRTGLVDHYDPADNIRARKYTDKDRLHAEMSYYVPNISIAYAAIKK